MQTPGIFTTGYSANNTDVPFAYFSSDDTTYGVGLRKNSSGQDEAALGLSVAQVQSTGLKYISLKDALNYAEAGDTITLLGEINPITENEAGNWGGWLAIISKAVTLDLNGQVIRTDLSSVVILIDGAAAAIIDSDPDKQHTASPVTYTDPVTNDNVTVNGGVITGNFASTGVRIENGGSLSMSAGTIVGNHKYFGAGVYVVSGSFSMSGSASVSGNTAASGGGGVNIENGSFSISGSAAVTGNKKGSAENNVYLPSGKIITVSGGLTDGASVGRVFREQYGCSFRVFLQRQHGLWRRAEEQ